MCRPMATAPSIHGSAPGNGEARPRARPGEDFTLDPRSPWIPRWPRRPAPILPTLLLLGGLLALPGVARAQATCDVTFLPSEGGVIAGTAPSFVLDPELEVEIHPQLEFVRLENSQIRIVFREHLPGISWQIRDFVIKGANEDQFPLGNEFMNAGAGDGLIQSVTLVEDFPSHKKVRFVWGRWDVGKQQHAPDQKIIEEFTIYPHSRFVRVDYVDIQWKTNISDLGQPGGTLAGEHIAHGGEGAPRGYLTHDEPLGVFYSRYPGDGVFDPPDGGPLNYNGNFVVAVFNPANGRGFGRVTPVFDTDVIKLLLLPQSRRGLEHQTHAFNQPHAPFVGYIYAVTGGGQDALDFGRMLVDTGGSPTTLACGEVLNLQSVPYTNWEFSAWAGDLAGQVIDPLAVPASDGLVVGADFVQSPGFHVEDFEALDVGSDPAAWLDTGAGNSLSEDDSLFEVEEIDGNRSFGTTSTATNIHSHLLDGNVEVLPGYEWSGRFRVSDADGALGVTVFSQFPDSAAYYRLRRLPGGSFHLSPVGTSLSGDLETDVVPTPGVWYRFRVQVEDTGTRTDLRAMVWRDGSPEPVLWQAQAFDDSAGRLTDGKPGLWTYNLGRKSFDELAVHALQSAPTDLVLTLTPQGPGQIVATPDQATYPFGAPVSLQAVPDPGHAFAGWGSALSGNQNPQPLFMTGDLEVTAQFVAVTSHTLDVTVQGAGAVTRSPDLPLYDLGSSVELTAQAAPGWIFAGFSGDLASSVSPATLTISGDSNVTATFTTQPLAEDFESYAPGSNPPDFLDTASGNSLLTDDTLFRTLDVSGNQTFGTTSGQTNIHSHFIAPGSASMSAYEWSGRMRIGSFNGGIGVTFFSQMPDQAAYYRLRRYAGTSFHLAPLGATLTGDLDTGVTPVPDTWYRFRIQVEDLADRTEVRARVWQDGTPEPSTWSADAFDDSPGRLRSGTVGTWAMGAGAKYWDDLEVLALTPPDVDVVLSTLAIGDGSIVVTPDQPIYTFGDVVQLEAVPGPGQVFTGWSGDLSGTNPQESLTLTGDASVTASFAPLVLHPLTLGANGDGTVSASPDQTEYLTGSTVQITATPAPGWLFDGWSGDASGSQNPLSLLIDGPKQVSADFVEAVVLEDFEGQAPGSNPPSWVDTGPSNSLVPSDLFAVRDVAGTATFGTASAFTNIHSHYTGAGSAGLAGYRYSGRMRIGDRNGGIGVTFLSQFPGSVAYYRLRRYQGQGFHLAPVGTQTTAGTTETGVTPLANRWYRFVVEAEDLGDRTEVRAKVWDESTAEPADFQAVATDASATRLTTGTIGLWSMGPGGKDWDDLRVELLTPPRDDIVITTSPGADGSILVTPDQATYSTNELVTFEALPDAGFVFTGWNTGLSGVENPLTVPVVDDLVVGADFAPITNHTVTVTVDGAGSVDVAPPGPLHPLGSVVTLTATADPGSVFSGWSGDVTSAENPLAWTVTGDLALTASFANAALVASFDALAPGADPPGWVDTAAGNSLGVDDSLFAVRDVAGARGFGTTSSLVNIHSHYAADGSALWSGYEYTGRMRLGSSSGGIGVTFLSGFPDQARYYRLRRYQGTDFHFAPFGTVLTGGNGATGVTPLANVWYRFKIQVEDTGPRTELRAKVWAEGDPEPTGWQADAWDDSPTRLTTGTVGVWTMAGGSKTFDDLRVELLGPIPTDLVLDVQTVGAGGVIVTPDQPLYTQGEVVGLEAVPDPGHVFTGWTGALSGVENPTSLVMAGDRSVTASFAPLTTHTLTLQSDGPGSVVPDPDQALYTLGETVTLTAVPDPGFRFAGWSGDLSGDANPAQLPITGDLTVSARFDDVLYAEDFEGFAAGADPPAWTDTAALNSTSEDDSLFQVRSVAGGLAFGTSSTAINVHSHYDAAGAAALSGYVYTGRMRMGNANSGLGVTFLSQFPSQAAYYRLRRYQGRGFHLSPLGTTLTGQLETGVTPVANVWYRFHVEVEDTGSETRIRAKVWAESDPEPATFQVDVGDASATRLTAGTFGVWSMAAGTKEWDDLVVAPLP